VSRLAPLQHVSRHRQCEEGDTASKPARRHADWRRSVSRVPRIRHLHQLQWVGAGLILFLVRRLTFCCTCHAAVRWPGGRAACFSVCDGVTPVAVRFF
jgi:hypothetical protein